MVILAKQQSGEQGLRPQFSNSLHIHHSVHWIISNGLLSGFSWMCKKSSFEWGQGGNDRHYLDILGYNIIQQNGAIFCSEGLVTVLMLLKTFVRALVICHALAFFFLLTLICCKKTQKFRNQVSFIHTRNEGPVWISETWGFNGI